MGTAVRTAEKTVIESQFELHFVCGTCRRAMMKETSESSFIITTKPWVSHFFSLVSEKHRCSRVYMHGYTSGIMHPSCYSRRYSPAIMSPRLCKNLKNRQHTPRQPNGLSVTLLSNLFRSRNVTHVCSRFATRRNPYPPSVYTLHAHTLVKTQSLWTPGFKIPLIL